VLALHREKDEDGGRKTLLLSLKRRNLGRPESEPPSELVWTGTHYADPASRRALRANVRRVRRAVKWSCLGFGRRWART
jgi:hypothetical protein